MLLLVKYTDRLLYQMTHVFLDTSNELVKNISYWLLCHSEILFIEILSPFSCVRVTILCLEPNNINIPFLKRACLLSANFAMSYIHIVL